MPLLQILEHFWRCFADTSNLKHSRQVLTLGARLMVRPILEKTTEHLEQLTTPEVKKVMMQALMADSEGAGSGEALAYSDSFSLM